MCHVRLGDTRPCSSDDRVRGYRDLKQGFVVGESVECLGEVRHLEGHSGRARFPPQEWTKKRSCL